MADDDILIIHDGRLVKAQLLEDRDGVITYKYQGATCVTASIRDVQ